MSIFALFDLSICIFCFLKPPKKYENIIALFSRKTTWQSAVDGVVAGTIVLVIWIWKQVGLGEELYEIVPGFFSNLLVICILNFFIRQNNHKVKKTFDAVVKEIESNRSSVI
jgi:sodium/proline symporter